MDSLPGIAASLNRTLNAHGLSGHSDAAVRSFVGDGLETLVRRAAPAGADPSLIRSLVALFKKDYQLSWPDGTAAYPGIHGMLDELQREGFQLAVLSNKTHEFTGTITQTVFPLVRFAQALGQQDGVPHKPDPAGALRIATAMGSAPEQCIVIGDSTIDLQTAVNAGMQAVAVSWGYHDRERLIDAGATRIAGQPSELPEILAGLSN